MAYFRSVGAYAQTYLTRPSQMNTPLGQPPT
jgi:hypothetical protein